MTDHALPAIPPLVNPETAPFWAAAAEGTLLLKHCRSCDALHWYPRTMCPACGSFDTEWIQASGLGTVHSFTVTRRGAPVPYAEVGPYVLAYVELDEGPRVLTNVVECDPDAVRIDDRVEVVFHDTGHQSALPRFRPTRR